MMYEEEMEAGGSDSSDSIYYGLYISHHKPAYLEHKKNTLNGIQPNIPS
jgi:hypothetical protein